MIDSMTLAKIVGLAMAVGGVSLLRHPQYYKKLMRECWTSKFMPLLSGYMALIVGAILVTGHNVWEGAPWVIIITIIGWLSLIKGVLLLVAPRSLFKLSKSLINSSGYYKVASLVYLVLGVYLLYIAFG